MQLAGMARHIPVNSYHFDALLAAIEGGNLEPLDELFQLSHQQWYSDQGKGVRYAVSWVLVHFLLSSESNREFTRKMMDNWAVHYCQAFSEDNYFNRFCPGGLSGFEPDWTLWLTSGGVLAHNY